MKTREQLIEAMRNELFDSAYCMSDFSKWDVHAIECSLEPFFWLVSTGTHLVRCGTTQITGILGVEAGRMRVFRDPYSPISAITYYEHSNYPKKLFYWDGFDLHKITFEEARVIWGNLASWSIAQAKVEYVEEYRLRDELLPIKFASKETEESYRESLEYSDALGDDSLARCVERLTKYQRVAVDQYILISADFTEHGYCFGEMVNGECIMNGGIIPDLKKSEDRWQIHT